MSLAGKSELTAHHRVGGRLSLCRYVYAQRRTFGAYVLSSDGFFELLLSRSWARELHMVSYVLINFR